VSVKCYNNLGSSSALIDIHIKRGLGMDLTPRSCYVLFAR
jgi:hypothetical protein